MTELIEAAAPVFLHSAFRSGSTWFWNCFREARGTCAYYEPFHESKMSLTAEDIATDTSEGWESGHPLLSRPYNTEYLGLLRPGGGVANYKEHFAYLGYYRVVDEERRVYLETLVKHASLQRKVPVLGFKRSLGRVAGIKAQCGGIHIVTLRNPWDQWASLVTQARRGNRYFGVRLHLIAALARHATDYADFFAGLNLFLATDDPSPDFYALPAAAQFRLFLRIFLLDSLLALPEADAIVDLDRMSDDSAYCDDMTTTLRRITGLATLRFDGCNLPPHAPEDIPSVRAALVEALAILDSHPIAIGRDTRLVRAKLEEALLRFPSPAETLPNTDALCRGLMAVAGGNVEDLKRLGVVAQILDRHDDAVTAFDAALQARPDDADAHVNRASSLVQLDRLAEAIDAFDSAIRLRPDHAKAHYNLGNALMKMGRIEEAVASYGTALHIEPTYIKPHYNRANALIDLGRLDEAVAAYRITTLVSPDYSEAHSNRGSALLALGRYEQALGAFNTALRISPDLAEAHYNRGRVLQELERPEEALAAYDTAIGLMPDHGPAHTNRGNILRDQGRFDDALMSFDIAARQGTGEAQAHCNRGNALQDLGRLDEALAAFDTSIRLRPLDAEAHSNRGTVLKDLGRLDDAVDAFVAAQRLDPDLAAARYNEAFPRLLAGDFALGWPQYEWRWRIGSKRLRPRDFAQPQWSGQPVAGKTILLHAEQGLGDTIQFCRYAPLLAGLGARVLMEVPKAMINLLSGLAGVDRLIVAGAPLPDFDLHCPMMSLPGAFGTGLSDIPGEIPYLAADQTASRNWADRLAKDHRPRIGLVWAGNPTHRNDRNRSVPFAALGNLLRLDHVHWYSLQVGARRDDLAEAPIGAIEDLAPLLDDFAATAAILSQLDLVITADTAVAHLAGALGRKTWVMLPFAPDWRWLMHRPDSPWYPTLRLVRQIERGDWTGVTSRIAEALRLGTEPA